MRTVNRSSIVAYSPQQMFDLVNDIESYPSFLPWCSDARVEDRNEETVKATLELSKGAMSNHFTTLNTLHEPEAIDLSLLGGPFKHLAGGWRFQALGDEGCKVSLELDFAFSSMLVDMMFGTFFEDTCNSLVDAFTRRAESVYGAG